MSPFVTLFIAIAGEIVAITSLKLSDGFTKPLPSIIVVIGYGLAFYMLSLTLKNMPLGTAYAIWSALGTAGAVVIGVLVWRDPLDLPRIVGVVLIVIGVIILNVFGEGTQTA